MVHHIHHNPHHNTIKRKGIVSGNFAPSASIIQGVNGPSSYSVTSNSNPLGSYNPTGLTSVGVPITSTGTSKSTSVTPVSTTTPVSKVTPIPKVTPQGPLTTDQYSKIKADMAAHAAALAAGQNAQNAEITTLKNQNPGGAGVEANMQSIVDHNNAQSGNNVSSYETSQEQIAQTNYENGQNQGAYHG